MVSSIERFHRIITVKHAKHDNACLAGYADNEWAAVSLNYTEQGNNNNNNNNNAVTTLVR